MSHPSRSKAYRPPSRLEDYPTGTVFPAGHLVETSSGWRSKRPVIDTERCINCLVCWLLCPEGVIRKSPDGRLEIDYDYCKGCGICARECHPGVILMKQEGA
ncbi:MAG: 4Fe-4S binding protein [Chlorobiaceae bacterium]|nr:4Fe-4S binding protein [Chlorobiaceae bacterium]